jgi:hypothetical protein
LRGRIEILREQQLLAAVQQDGGEAGVGALAGLSVVGLRTGMVMSPGTMLPSISKLKSIIGFSLP